MAKKQNNYTSDVIKLNNVRLSFPEIWKPKAFEKDKEPKFQATFLLDPSSKEHAKLIKTIKKSFKDLCKEAGFDDLDDVYTPFGLADKHKKKKEYAGYPGMFWIQTSNKTRPTLINRDKSPIVEEDGILYAGCYVNTNVTLWTYDHPTGGEGVGVNLRIVQFVKDGESFGAGSADPDEMDEVDAEDWDEDDV